MSLRSIEQDFTVEADCRSRELERDRKMREAGRGLEEADETMAGAEKGRDLHASGVLRHVSLLEGCAE